MKRNLKIFLLIAVCAITGICMLCVREENKKQQIHSVKKEEKENKTTSGIVLSTGNTGVSYVQKRNKTYF